MYHVIVRLTSGHRYVDVLPDNVGDALKNRWRAAALTPRDHRAEAFHLSFSADHSIIVAASEVAAMEFIYVAEEPEDSKINDPDHDVSPFHG